MVDEIGYLPFGRRGEPVLQRGGQTLRARQPLATSSSQPKRAICALAHHHAAGALADVRNGPQAAAPIGLVGCFTHFGAGGTRKLPLAALQVAVEALDLALGLGPVRSAQPRREAAALGQLEQLVVPALQAILSIGKLPPGDSEGHSL